MSNRAGKRQGASKAHPCPVCRGVDKCSSYEDGLILCGHRMGEQPGFHNLKACPGDPQFWCYRRVGDPKYREQRNSHQTRFPKPKWAPPQKPPPPPPKSNNGKPPVDWQERARELAANLTADLRGELAMALGLPESCLEALPLIGHADRGPHKEKQYGPCWTFPQVDGAGSIIGISCRYRDETKLNWFGGQGGLFAAAGWRDHDGPLYLPEGASDTLALSALGLPAMGRPSNKGGAEYLAELLRGVPVDRPIIVLGENDPRPHKEHAGEVDWPGLEGAKFTTEKLTAALGRVIPWALPPGRSKDVRTWLREQRPDLSSTDELHGLGERFEATLQRPPPTPPPKDDEKQAKQPTPLSLGDLVERHPELRPPVIHGLLRKGETANVIASSKVGKSWLVIDLALAQATGSPWLGTFQTTGGQVLILDNELHAETLSDRIRKVAEKREISLDDVRERIFVQNFRGGLKDVFSLRDYFGQFERGRFALVIVDTLYRMLPAGLSENDNAGLAAVYNAIDSYAEALGCCFVPIHHASKGAQADKSVTDVGAGAGAQSRAADTHLVLRPHQEKDVFVLEAAVRSWAPLKPRCLRWEFPVWQPADDLNPDLLQRPAEKKKDAKAKEDDGALLAALDRLDPNREGCGQKELREALSWNQYRLNTAIQRLCADGILETFDLKYTSGKGRESEKPGVRRRSPNTGGTDGYF